VKRRAFIAGSGARRRGRSRHVRSSGPSLHHAMVGDHDLPARGGFREGRVGELVIGRASVLLRTNGLSISLVPLRHHPEQAGLLGGVYLAPEEVLREYRGILAVDIGGTNVRTGIVEPDIDADGSILDARVHSYELWRHADRKPDKQKLLDHRAKDASAACEGRHAQPIPPPRPCARRGHVPGDGVGRR
jgi:hypothetical protein